MFGKEAEPLTRHGKCRERRVELARDDDRASKIYLKTASPSSNTSIAIDEGGTKNLYHVSHENATF